VLEQGPLQGVAVPGGRYAMDERLVQRIGQLAKHVELELVGGGIADAHRRRAFVAR
jgi:hypothetical protein